MTRRAAALAAVIAAAVLSGCGGGSPARTPPPAAHLTPADGRRVPATPQRGLAAGLTVGMGDQGTAFFTDPAYRALHLDRVRFVASYDAVAVGFDRAATDAWLGAATAAHAEPLVAFSHSRRKGRTRHLPGVAEFRDAFAAFHARYPGVRLITPWNEPNHESQPTDHRPARAAAYAKAVADVCPDCRIVAGDFLDEPGAAAYARAYRRALDPSVHPVAWGVHDYSSTNRFTPGRVAPLLDAIPGEVWLTETGGLARFGRAFPMDLTRQARATNYLFVLARADRRIERVYLYNWTGAPPDARFDAGLTNPDGSTRPAYDNVRAALGR